MLKKKKVSSPFSPFPQCWQVFTSCKTGNPGKLCKDYLFLPTSRHCCVLFSLRLCRGPACFSNSPSVSCLGATVYLLLSRFDPASPCKPEKNNSLPVSGDPWAYCFLTSLESSKVLRSYMLCALWMDFSFFCSTYLSVTPFSQENYSKVASHQNIFLSGHGHLFRCALLIPASTLVLFRP